MTIPLHVENRGAAVTVVAFSGLAPKNHMFEWLRSFERLPVNIVGVQDPANDWYTSRAREITGAVLGGITACRTDNPEQRVVFIGASAGGFAALRFSREIRVARILAFSPQSCCGPRASMLGDDRWPEFRRNVKSEDRRLCDIEHMMFSRDVTVHYDINDSLDAMHADRVFGAQKIQHHSGGHDLPHALKAAGLLERFVAAAITFEAAGVTT